MITLNETQSDLMERYAHAMWDAVEADKMEPRPWKAEYAYEGCSRFEPDRINVRNYALRMLISLGHIPPGEYTYDNPYPGH